MDGFLSYSNTGRNDVGDDQIFAQWSFAQTRYGIERPAIDCTATIVPLLSEAIYGKELSNYFPNEGHSISARKALPSFMVPPCGLNGFSSYLVHSVLNKSRTSCLRVKFFPNGQRILAGTPASELALWNSIHFTFEDLKRLPQGGGAITAIEWAPLEDRVYVGDATGQVVILSHALNPIENQALEGLCRPIMDLSTSPQGKFLAGCAEFSNPVIWDVTQLTILRLLRANHLDSCYSSSLDWHPTKALIATGTKSGWLYLWDPRDASPVATLQPHRSSIHRAVFHPHGNMILTCSRDTLIRSLDIRMLLPFQLFRLPQCNNQCSFSSSGNQSTSPEPLQLVINPTQKHIFCVGDSIGGLSFFDMSSPTSTAFHIHNAHGGLGLSERDGAILSLDWHPSGHTLVGASDDRLLRFWSRGNSGGVGGSIIDGASLCELEGAGSFPISRFKNIEKDMNVAHSAPKIANVSLRQLGSRSTTINSRGKLQKERFWNTQVPKRKGGLGSYKQNKFKTKMLTSFVSKS